MNKCLVDKIFLVVFSLTFFSCSSNAQNTSRKVDSKIWVRSGYELSIAVNSDQRTRHMCIGPDGTLYYNTHDKIIMAAKDKDNDGYYETLTQFHVSDDVTTAVLWYDGWLWYAETGAILNSGIIIMMV